MIRLSLVGVRVEVPSNQPIVLLREEAPGRRYLPIFIGQPEATAIVYALQGMESPRPMTHDLFKNVLEELTARIDRIVITELKDGTFYAELEVVLGTNRHRISSRPSDAIALAVRAGARIFAVDEVIEESGIEFEGEGNEHDELAGVTPLAELDPDEFRRFLDTVSPDEFAKDEE